jgi:hypothetical protein
MLKYIILLLCATYSASHAQTAAFAPSLASLSAMQNAAYPSILHSQNSLKTTAQSDRISGSWFTLEAAGIFFDAIVPSLESHMASYNTVFQPHLTKGFTPMQARGGFNVGFNYVRPYMSFGLGYMQYWAHSEAVFFSGFKREIDLMQQGTYFFYGMGFWNGSLPERLRIYANIGLYTTTGRLLSGTRYPDGTLSYAWEYQNRFNAQYIIPWGFNVSTGISAYYKLGRHFLISAQGEYIGLVSIEGAPSVNGPLEPFGDDNAYGGGSSFSSIYYSPRRTMVATVTTPEGRGTGDVNMAGLRGFAWRFGVGYIF